MKNILQSFVILASGLVLSNCTTYVAPETEPATTATTTTTRTTASPYTGERMTTKETTTTYQ